MYKLGRGSILAAFVSLLSACGGGNNIGSGSTATVNPITCPAGQVLDANRTCVSSTGTSTPATPVYRMGTLNGGTFTPAVIQATSANVAAGGSTGLKVDIVDTANGNQLVADQTISITFSSSCTGSGLSTVVSPVITATGSATSTYAAKGCSGQDQISANAVVGTQNLVATVTVNVAASPFSSIQFTTVSTNAIRIKGTGDPQTAVVVFSATNSAGGPAQNQPVKFSLDTTAGGITFSPASGTTDSTGKVQTTVSSGTVATSVRVTATAVDAAGAAIAGVPPAQSDSLVISTGLADQNSFSLSAGCFNIEGADIDGTTTPINILAADRFNNPVPKGTAIAFRTEGGQVGSQCLTDANGFCTVNFTSAQPRTADHRVTVLAAAIGEESFTDSNGNGQYDSGEAFADLPEAFLDKNENGVRETNEEFVDFNNNGNFDAASGNFTGVLCKSGCDSATSLSVRADLPIIMSGSTATLLASPSNVDLSNGPVVVQVTMGDSADQPMPSGTTLTATTSFGAIIGGSSYTQACSSFNGPFVYTFVLQAPDGQATSKSGVLTLKATSPKGVVSTVTVPVNFTVGGTTTPPPPGPLKSITAVSANPTLISIKGTGVGQPETSDVTFRVLDDKGNPLSGQSVSFATDTTAGGITLDKSSATSDGNGLVVVNLRAGTVNTTVRVTATATSGSTTVSIRSDTVTISTAIPDQDSFSLSTPQQNLEGGEIDGLTSTITIRMADRFNNPVPDGTRVAFRAEGGSVTPTCTTTGGACPVTFTTQNPRTADHRYTVLATAGGEESFTDLNGNGAFDSGEPFADFSEAFLDRNKNGIRDAASEEFVDFNNNTVFDAASGNFTGVLCNGGCDTSKFLSVRGNIEFVFSSSTAVISSNPAVLTFATATDASQTIDITVQDTANQAMASGTKIEAVSDYGTVTAEGGGSSYTQLDTTAPGGTQVYTFIVTADQTAPTKRGRVTIKVTTPSGVINLFTILVN